MNVLMMSTTVRNLRFVLLLGSLLIPALLIAQPVVNLGSDFATCGSAVLDAGNPGSTYLWSNGPSSQTITVTTSGSYWVEVTNGQGTDRDTVNVTIVSTPADPVLTNTSVCGTSPVTLASNTTADLISWYNAPSGGSIVATGSSITSTFPVTTTLYVEAQNYGAPQTVGRVAPAAQGGYFFINNTRGMVFNVLTPMILESVTVYTTGLINGFIDLLNPQGAVVYTSALTLPQAGANLVNINYQILPGTGYELRIRNMTGADIRVDYPVTFPLTYPGIVFTGGNPIASHYNYFFNWKVRTGLCYSSRLPVTVSALATPQVSLGNDSTFCGSSTTLNAGNAGAAFLWSTGATTQSILATGSGLYWAEVSQGACSDRDSIIIGLIATPPNPATSNLTVCGVGEAQLVANSAADKILWYDAPSGGSIVDSGSVLTQSFSSTTTLYAEAQNLGLTSTIGRTTPQQGGYFFIGDIRGMVFDVINPVLLESVSVLKSGNTVNGVIELIDAQNIVLFTSSFSLTVSGANVIQIGTFLLPGNNYQLRLRNMTGGEVRVDYPTTFPLNYGDIRFTGGNPIPNHYNYFFNWKIKKAYCISGRSPATVTVLPEPVLNLGADTILCGSTLLLDVSFPGASYLWSDSSTAPTYLVQSSQTISVTSTLGTCFASDTLEVAVLDQPAAPFVQDLSVCGSGIYSLSSVNTQGIPVWYDAPSGGNNLEIGPVLDTYVLGDKTFYVEAQEYYSAGITALPEMGSAFGAYFPIGGERGMRFDVLNPIQLDSVTIFANGTLSGNFFIRDADDNVLFSVNLNYPSSNGVVVPVGILLRQGAGYEMVFKTFTNSNLRVDYPISYPLTYEDVVLTGGFPIGNHYNYFYRWQISKGLCNSNRVPLDVDVKLPFDLPDSIYSCDPVLLDSDNPSATHLWNTGATTEAITVLNTGTYSVTVSDNSGCVVKDTAFVDIPQNAGLPDDGILCGNTLYTNYGEDAVYLWSNGDTTSFLDITQPGTYFVQVLEPRGCLLTDTIQVTGFDAFPVVTLGNDKFGCVSIELDAGIQGQQYVWNTGATTQTISPTSSGSYWVIVTNSNGCSGSDTVGLLIEPEPVADFIYTTLGYQVDFINISVIFASYNWIFGDGTSTTDFNPTHIYADTGVYFASLVAVNQCGVDTFTQAVHVRGTSGVTDELARAGIMVGPNPANEYLNVIQKQAIQDPVSLQMFDLAGRRVLGQQLEPGIEMQQIDIRLLPPGAYVVRISWGDRIGHTHLLISR